MLACPSAPAEAAKMTIKLEIRLKSYIAHPMTRERSEVISIQKASGFNVSFRQRCLTPRS